MVCIPSFYRSFADSPAGLRLTAACYAHQVGFVECSVVGVPAVAALVPHLERHEPWIKRHDLAKNYLGWLTGDIMRRRGHDMVHEAKPIRGDIFTVGAVWSAAPMVMPAAA